MTKVKKSSILLTCLLLALLCGLLFYIDGNASKYIIRITRLCAINIVLALSMNLVNGFTGIFSLGHAGFMAIGAYTVALLTIPVAKKETIFMLEPLIAPLNTLTLPFGAALIIGGLLAAALAWLFAESVLQARPIPALTKALRTALPLAVLAGVCYNFCVYFAAEPQLMGQNPALYENVSRLVQFWL